MRTGRLVFLLAAAITASVSCSQSPPAADIVGAANERIERDHLEAVVKLAVAVTNPADRLAVTGSRLDESMDGYEFRPISVFFPTSSGVFSSARVPYAVRLDKSGHVQEINQMPENRLSLAMGEFGNERNGDGSDRVLKSVGSGVRTTVLIKLRQPVQERDLNLFVSSESSAPVLLSGVRRTGNPIYWSGEEGCFKSATQRDCASYSSLAQFKSWVAQLRPNDDTTLNGFGLSVAELRQAATAGLIYGTIVDGGSPAAIRKLRKHPNVSGMWITDMRPCPRGDECP
ncbi:hypothetical protein BJ981_000750 [Sphaerisporangium krabiense]|uniref:Lipoprotein n=1 Tax=Sphaerisporangium krabiense TaxID=763782 RepID=A0A7W8Z062_9ACTN|nr:hypothetical protein [Sphaerisporangium krabiense]